MSESKPSTFGPYKAHPAADAFPMLPEDELQALAFDISSQGLLQPIVTSGEWLIDGRNRWRACEIAGVEPRTEARGFDTDEDAIAFIVSSNLRRRHMDRSQRSMVAARLAALPAHRPRSGSNDLLTQRQAAESLNVSVPTIKRARVVLDKGTPELVAAVDSGVVKVGPAAALAKEAPEVQREAIRRVQTGESKNVEAALREKKAEEKRAARRKIAEQNTPLALGLYDVIVVDPPWPMQKIARDVRPLQTGFDYPTMTLQEIAAFQIPGQYAAPDCHLFVWTTQKYLPAALDVIREWGFRYVFLMVWHKPGGFQPIGLPQYNCEFALYARKGSPVFKDTKAFPCCFNAPRGAHSEKPQAFYDTIARVTDGRRLDVFARREIKGFDRWGNEA